jgi:hypothetical protein
MEDIDTFLSGEHFTSLINEATSEGEDSPAMDLVKMIDLCVESMTFFMKINHTERFKRELDQLRAIINHVETIYENQ